jgi:hypothetical protein
MAYSASQPCFLKTKLGISFCLHMETKNPELGEKNWLSCLWFWKQSEKKYGGKMPFLVVGGEETLFPKP